MEQAWTGQSIRTNNNDNYSTHLATFWFSTKHLGFLHDSGAVDNSKSLSLE